MKTHIIKWICCFLLNDKYLTLTDTVNEAKGCPVNYFFDVDKKNCTECPPGSFGQNCSAPCPPKSYGRLCAEDCSECPQDECDKVTGCQGTSTKPEFYRSSTTISSAVTSVFEISSSILPTSLSTDRLTTILKSKPSQPSTVETKDEPSILTIILIVVGFAALIIIILIAILFIVVRRLWVLHTKRTYHRTENESKHLKEGNESGEYQEIEIDRNLVIQSEVSGHRYNTIMQEMDQPIGTKYEEPRSKINQEMKTLYSHYREIDEENSSSTGNNGGYIEPESSGQIHAYLEVIEPIVHSSDSAYSYNDGVSLKCHRSDQNSDHIEENDDNYLSASNAIEIHEAKDNDYLDVVHNK
ncbi:uncharacterized protein LOC134230465 [Saccostrea cucullata]|uniref:uncharacterized protein LOC134230465 n=1 Tax=Saccostrea cuccullata TaxID=36930 RepID=UPI002ED6A076